MLLYRPMHAPGDETELFVHGPSGKRKKRNMVDLMLNLVTASWSLALDPKTCVKPAVPCVLYR